MQLDMQTMSAVNITVTAILGGVLLFTWAQERESPLVGWWGLALMIQAAGVATVAASSPLNATELLAIGMATIVLSDALKWKAAREFAQGHARLLWILLGPVDFYSPRIPAIWTPLTNGSVASVPSWRRTISRRRTRCRAPTASRCRRAGPP
jgi:hypothetical protein